MKKILIPLGTLLVSGLAYGQASGASSAENYIESRTYLEPVTASSSTARQMQTVQYFDGLGRPKQVVNVKASPSGKDLVTPIAYDGFGRAVDSWLPVPMSTQNGGIQSGVNAAGTTYYADSRPFGHKDLEKSPLDRVFAQVQPGQDWQGHPVQLQYDTNNDSEVYKFVTTTGFSNGASSSVLKTSVNSDHASSGFYKANKLYKNTVTDEDGNQTVEFKNAGGQVILVRKIISASESADTYYVYNENNLLVFVIPPKAVGLLKGSGLSAGQMVGDTLLNDLCYQYRYDSRRRIAEKKLPGKGWEYMIYDKQDRLVMSQDANIGLLKQWLFTKYDQYGRTAYTGVYTSTQDYGSAGRVAEQGNVDSRGSNNVGNTTMVGFTSTGMDVYYDNGTVNSYPNSITKLLSVNYYDSYPLYSFNPSFPSGILSEPVLTDNSSSESRSTKGLPVMSLVKNIEDDNWTKNYTYYDKKGRAIGSYSINHLRGYTKTESLLDFAGVAQRVNTYHLRRQGEFGVFVTEGFIYDHQNRLLQHYHKVDDKPEVILADNTYNELSQLSNKKVGNNLQSIDYTYNIRGWMTHINKDQMPLSDLGGRLFSYRIRYNEKEGLTNPDPVLFSGKDVVPKYNGNIAEVDWRSVENIGNNPSLTPKRYGYAYDRLNRLTAGYYQNPNNPNSKESTESLDYDLNGNITNLYRTSVIESGNTATAIDRLEYFYGPGNNSNRLSSITDHQNNPTGYEGGNQQMGYDLNGNMIVMPDKGISKIAYNYLNLPDKLNYAKEFETVTVNTKYGSDGSKLQKQNMTTVDGISGPVTVKKTTDYLDGFQYLKTENIGLIGMSAEMMSGLETSRALERQAFSVEPMAASATLSSKNSDLQFFPTAEGFYDYKKDQYIYQYKDHLGNARVSFGRNSAGALEITDANDYYPFGMNHLKSGNSFFGINSYKNYKYNGKELQESGMYDYGARMYMPDIGRWGVMDPLSETSRRWSPYTYGYNNPIRFVDPDGRQNEDWVKRGNQIFYDSAITTQKQATDKYGDSAEHLAEGSTLTTKTNDEVTSELTFHDNGTITKADGSEKITKETFEKGGISIIGTESKGLSMSLSVNGVLGGGFGFDVGLVKDAGNNWGLFFNRNINFGLGFEGGIGIGRISSSHSGPFLLEDYSGEAKSFISPVGITYGGTFDPKSTPIQMMNPLNVGYGQRGATEISAGIKGIGTGIFYKRSKTSVWDF